MAVSSLIKLTGHEIPLTPSADDDWHVQAEDERCCKLGKTLEKN